jgi:hypothetical protein
MARISPGSLNAGFYFQLTASLAGLPGGGVAVPSDDGGVVVQAGWVTGGCTPADYRDLSVCAAGACPNSGNRVLVMARSNAAAGSPASVGLTTQYGKDDATSAGCPDRGRFIGPAERRDALIPGGRVLMLSLRGQVPSCGTGDINNDGDTGTDADIEAFFACLAGHCCPTCQTADFNHDGDFGTDQDIEAFFRVLGGGIC